MPSDAESSISAATSRNTTSNARRLPDLPSWGPRRPQVQYQPSSSHQQRRGRIESSMSVASAASTSAAPYTATLRPTSYTYDNNGGSRGRSSSYGPTQREAGRQGQMVGHSGLEHPGMRNRQSFTLLAKQDLERAEVFAIIHRIRRDIKKCIETALSYEQINSPRLVFSVMRPLQDAYMNLNSPCTIYALLLNRVYFSSQTYTLSSLSVNNTRAMVCEILAIKILRALYEEDTSENGVFRLAILLASTFSPFQGAPDWALPEDLDPKHTGSAAEAAMNDRKISSSALELAIVSEAKRFIRAVPTQKVILDIWRGKIVYSSMSFRYIIKDQYKRRPIMKYNPRNAPLLDHYRLRVPRIRAALEWLHFTILFASYLVVLKTMNKHRMNAYEIFWVVYGFGFALDKVASLLELGWTVFTSNLWNGLDFVFVIMFLLYLPLRIIGLKNDHQLAATEALSILTCAGTILFPRFAFVTLSDNLLILSLRSMLAQFGKLMLLAVWCFAGFFVAILTLSHGKYRPWEVVQWMVWIWFGLDATGLVEATRVHNILGPILMVIYACLSNTLLVTVLVSILSNTFNLINKDATAEQMYRKAVSTFQGNKSDGIFSFQPPINILALAIILPCRPFVDAHQYHKIIVFLARATNFPLLLFIHAVERYILFIDHHDRPDWMKLHTYTFGLSGWWSGTRTNLDDVFEYEDDIDEDFLPESVFNADPDGTSRAPSPEPFKTHVDEPTEMDAREAHQAEEESDKQKKKQDEEEQAEIERLKRKRRTHSMSDWGATLAGNSTIKARPTILSKLYAPKKEDTIKESWKTFMDAAAANANGSSINVEEIEELKDRLQRIEEGQRRIEEALKGLGDSGD